ncbi:hypothetical protein K2O51_30865 (plasmid) [Cupriavidus pinatubonensis]|uniref:hypothetical protein n=1 Tax=Cupriavidus pinatubonensis TaxID=248026 RepID=UPI001C73A9CD|nr:hypothetical protein [Cupriavidus pinatubonensis]QYY33651.1 hypothetical protein K2O51_30865 [Cupriavidus pinatubonensis]
MTTLTILQNAGGMHAHANQILAGTFGALDTTGKFHIDPALVPASYFFSLMRNGVAVQPGDVTTIEADDAVVNAVKAMLTHSLGERWKEAYARAGQVAVRSLPGNEVAQLTEGTTPAVANQIQAIASSPTVMAQALASEGEIAAEGVRRAMEAFGCQPYEVGVALKNIRVDIWREDEHPDSDDEIDSTDETIYRFLELPTDEHFAVSTSAEAVTAGWSEERFLTSVPFTNPVPAIDAGGANEAYADVGATMRVMARTPEEASEIASAVFSNPQLRGMFANNINFTADQIYRAEQAPNEGDWAGHAATQAADDVINRARERSRDGGWGI